MPRSAWLFPLLLLGGDLVFVNLAWPLGLWVRFEGAVPELFRLAWVSLLAPVNLVHLAVFLALGYHRRIWRYAEARDMARLVVGQTVATGLLWIWVYYVAGLTYPRSAILLAAFGSLFATGGVRLLLRLADLGERGSPRGGGSRVLIVGAGEAGHLVVRELKRHPELGEVPVGFADDDPRKRGLLMSGLPVVADRANLERAVEELRVEEIIIAMPSASRWAVSEWVRVCSRTGKRVRMLPGVYELLDGEPDLSKLRDIRPEDLLGREPTDIDLEGTRECIRGRAVLVSGAGGSIGSELCRQLVRFGPARLLLLGNEENQLHDLALGLELEQPEVRGEIVLADIRDAVRVVRVFKEYRPDLVFHAAAHKHVPILETNPEEAVKNNVFGTMNMALAALEAKTRVFVYVSTDKAVSPTSVMGATKRVGEMIAQSLNALGQTVFVVVRFGNVLGSRGSVLPIFQRQVAAGGPVTVTDPEATRYFMTIEEACRLVIQTTAIGKKGQVLVLNMGTPMSIQDLAENVIRLAGKEPGRDVPIRVVGLRPGEKLHEELFTAYEQLGATSHKQIFVANQRALPWPDLRGRLEELRGLVEAGDVDTLTRGLFELARSGGNEGGAAGS